MCLSPFLFKEGFVWLIFIYTQLPGQRQACVCVCVSKPLWSSVVVHTVPDYLNTYLEIVCACLPLCFFFT